MSYPDNQHSPPEAAYAIPAQPDYATAVPATSKLAVASLVLGILAVLACFLPIIPGALAAALGLLAIKRTGPMKLQGRGLAIAGLALGCAAVFLSTLSLSIWLPALSRSREMAHRARCSANMRLLGQAMHAYALENDGHFPPELLVLRSPAGVAPEHFVCPSTDHRPAGDVPLALADNLSYIWVGAGLRSDASPDAVLLYEPVDHHRRDGANFLHVDGSVRFILRQQARAMIQQLGQGINPPDLSVLSDGGESGR